MTLRTRGSRLATAGLALCLVASTGCDSDASGGERRDSGVSPGHDAGHDAGRDAGGSAVCADLERQRQVFIARAVCETAADCALIGSCDSAQWDPVAVEDQAAAQAVRTAMNEAGCIETWDGPIPYADCTAGRCKVVDTAPNGDWLGPFCGQVPEDAGTDDAGEP